MSKYAKNYDGCVREFYRHTLRFPTLSLRDGVVEEVNFGLYGDSAVGEMDMVWYKGERFGLDKPVARLEAYEDAFGVLACLKDVIDALAEYDDNLIQPEEFCAVLVAHGFTDNT